MQLEKKMIMLKHSWFVEGWQLIDYRMSVTNNLSAFVARKLSGLIITSEVIANGTNEAVTGDTDYEI